MAVCMTCGRIFPDKSASCPACGDTQPAAVITPPTASRSRVGGGVRSMTWPVKIPHHEAPASEGDPASEGNPAATAAQAAEPESAAEGNVQRRAPRRAEIMAARRRDAKLYNRGLNWMKAQVRVHENDAPAAAAAEIVPVETIAPAQTAAVVPAIVETAAPPEAAVASATVEPAAPALVASEQAAPLPPAAEKAPAPAAEPPIAAAVVETPAADTPALDNLTDEVVPAEAGSAESALSAAVALEDETAALFSEPAAVMDLEPVKHGRRADDRRNEPDRKADPRPVPKRTDIFAGHSLWSWTDDRTARLAWLVVVAIVVALGYLSYRHGGFVPLVSKADKAIHDLGDVLFDWAPTPWQYAAGSILQVAIPLFFVVYFWWRRERVALVLALAWTGESLYNVAAYAADAVRMALPFYVNNGNGDPHDWHELLAHYDLLPYTVQISDGMRIMAAALLAMALVFAVASFVRPPERLDHRRTKPAGGAHFSLHRHSQKHAA